MTDADSFSRQTHALTPVAVHGRKFPGLEHAVQHLLKDACRRREHAAGHVISAPGSGS